MRYLLSIDQGTTSSRAIVYDESGHACASAQKEFTQFFPKSGWVEHDSMEIWESVVTTCHEALKKAGITASDITAIGITNQRETVVVWDRETGIPIHRAIVWQDRRTSEFIESLRESGHEEMIQKKTGLLLDPYFSASKISWILDTTDRLKDARDGKLAAGTIDTWLAYKLSNGRSFITDVTNASRTMLMDLQRGVWDDDLLLLFKIPRVLLPEIVSNSGQLGKADAQHFGAEIPICGMIGDQQSALFGQLCTEPGLVKCTYGTGCFMLMTIGEAPILSENRLLTTAAWKIGDAPMHYALEGSVFVGGAAIQWLRDGLKIIRTAPEVNDLAAQVPDSGGVVLVPAFTGLGAPYWDSSARGALLGINRGTTAAHIARATLEGIASQVTDLLGAMEADSGKHISTMRVDGGACASDLLMQMQADLLGAKVERPKNIETTALGATFMAGLGSGMWQNVSELHKIREVDQVFKSEMKVKDRRARLKTWRKAIRRARNWESK
ncbi:MAG: glycerol kinase GlpK [Chthoniobacterales bacterium]